MARSSEAALKTNGKSYQRYLYPGTRHGFPGNSTPRYDEALPDLPGSAVKFSRAGWQPASITRRTERYVNNIHKTANYVHFTRAGEFTLCSIRFWNSLAAS